MTATDPILWDGAKKIFIRKAPIPSYERTQEGIIEYKHMRLQVDGFLFIKNVPRNDSPCYKRSAYMQGNRVLISCRLELWLEISSCIYFWWFLYNYFNPFSVRLGMPAMLKNFIIENVDFDLCFESWRLTFFVPWRYKFSPGFIFANQRFTKISLNSRKFLLAKICILKVYVLLLRSPQSLFSL